MSDIKSIAQIKQEFEQSGDDKEALYVQYAGDSRKGVQNLITKYQKEAQKLVKERERLETMRFFEHKYSEYHAICGIDEAGRGPLAGPVVAGAVILPEDVEILYLNDSKKLSAARREELYEEIKERAICYGVGIASPERIDQINILQATYEAMRDAIAALMPAPDLLLVDAVHIPDETGGHHQRRCQKCFYCGGKYHRKSNKRSYDDGNGCIISRVWICRT